MRLQNPALAACFLAFATFVAAPALAAAGTAEAPFRYYTVLDGLTQSSVHDIEQDHAGYLWFTTARGLNRFDGREFDHYTIADGLPNNWLTSIHVSPANSIWVGDQKGSVTAIHGTRVADTFAPLEGADNPVVDIEFLGGDVLTVVEGVGIMRVGKSGIPYGSKYIAGDESTMITNLEIYGENIWVESETGLYKLHLGADTRLELLDDSVRKIHVDSRGELWAADTNGAVGIWKDAAVDPRITLNVDNDVVSIVTDQQGLVWVATENELFSFGRYGATDGHVDGALRKYGNIDRITSLFVDKEDSLWLSTEARLIRFLGDRFRNYKLRTGPDPVTVWAISEDSRGRFWFATQTKLLVREEDESVTVVGLDRGLPLGTVRDIVFDGTNTVWAGLPEEGLFAVDASSLKATRIEGTSDMVILDIDIAADGAIWFSTIGSGVYRYDTASQHLAKYSLPEATSVYSIDTWETGDVWYGADEVGLVHLSPDGNGGYDQEIVVDSLDGGRRLFNHIRLTGPESMWVATEEGGIFFFENGKATQYAADTPLADQTVYLLEPLENGSVVAGGEQGLYQFVPGEEKFAHFNPQVGFIGMETNVHSSFRDSSGNLWIGTVDGATRMDATRETPRAFEPTPTIVRIETELDGREVFDNQEIEQREFGAHITYAAISLLSPKGVQYSYKLIGEDSSWSTPTTNRSVSYPRIPPGSYEFIVRARYPGGEWGTQVASQRFTVSPYFWQTTWFAFLIIVAVTVAIRLVVTSRTRKVEWMNETLRAQVEERTRSIEQARQKLETSNERLSVEIDARAEVETRFRLAFENAPIGMGLLNDRGVLFDANPALRRMFWPTTDELPKAEFGQTICEDKRERATRLFRNIVSGERDQLTENARCIRDDGEELQTVVNCSAVRSETGEFLYAVLQIQDVTESLKLTMQLEYQASYDELTELLNRRAFEAQLEKAWDSAAGGGKQSYLMFMDLDQFKVVNDTSGHTAGDQLLRAVSEILVDSVRGNDIVGRLGGDEFGIILWECPTDIARRIAEEIRATIENFRFHWDTETYRIGVSIGGIPIDSRTGDTSELQQLADAACYAAKEAGRNRVHMVDGDKDSARAHRGQVRWVQRIREAMDSNRFAIYAQPIRRIIEKPNEPERLEILLRLRDPESRKLIPPGAFLPAAERYGLSVELDKWVVKSLLDTLFIHSAFQAEQRSYWINLSGSSVGDKRFAEFLTDAIKHSPLPPGTVNFEITETAVIRSVAEAGNLMTSLREMGCQFALDDFGSGLSSFGYLKKLPVDYLKIDGMFIRDILNDKTDRIFVKSIIDIAKTLNIKTIAEFVECDDIFKVVAELGAEYAQGFAVGRPYELAPRFPRSANAELAEFEAKAG